MESLRRTIAFSTSDGCSFGISAEVANMSGLMASLLEDDDPSEDDCGEIHLPNVTSRAFRKVVSFCEHHLTHPMNNISKPLKSANMEDNVEAWYAAFVNMEHVSLYELCLAANYLDIKPLLELTCASIACRIKGKLPEEIRATFEIPNAFTAEEEAQIRAENNWIQDA